MKSRYEIADASAKNQKPKIATSVADKKNHLSTTRSLNGLLQHNNTIP